MLNKQLWAMAGCKAQTRQVLLALSKYGIKPEFVVTMRSAGSADNNAMADLCEQLSITLYYSEDLSEYSHKLTQLDLLIVCRFNLIKESIFSLPKLGSINIHNALLPDYPGVHPVSWAILHGENTLGVTIHQIDSGIDSGAILLQKGFEYQDFMSIDLVNNMLDELAAHLAVTLMLTYRITNTLPSSVENIAPESQFYARRRTADDSLLEAPSSADLIRSNKVLPPPYPAPFFLDGEQKVNLLASYETDFPFRDGAKLNEVIAEVLEAVYLVNTSPKQVIISTSVKLEIGAILF